MDDVRARTLEVLDEVEIDADAEDPLLREGFVYEMLLAHEHQHNETMLQLLQMVDGYQLPGVDHGLAGEPVADGPEMIAVEAGRVRDRRRAGTGFAYDNERPRHAVELDAFEIDRTPVTNGAYIEFIADTGAEPPLYWEAAGEGGWVRTAMGRRARSTPTLPSSTSPGIRPTPSPAGPGRRLPTEFEWEAARSELERPRHGLGMDELPLPRLSGLRGVPLPRVLGGLLRRRAQGAARRLLGDPPDVARPSFRNWDLPQRRQIFSGLRCARDADA